MKDVPLKELIQQRDALNREIRYRQCMSQPKKMPKVKRAFTYWTLNTFRFPVILQIASEWWGIDVEGKTKVRLLDEIIDAQNKSMEKLKEGRWPKDGNNNRR